MWSRLILHAFCAGVEQIIDFRTTAEVTLRFFYTKTVKGVNYMTVEAMNERLLAKMEHEQGRFLSRVIDTEQFPALSMWRRYYVQDAILLVLQDRPIPEEQAAALQGVVSL